MHDISSDSEFNAGRNHVVVGWFTPDYRTLAERLADQLAAAGSPFHLYAWNKHPGGWDTSPKPTVVLHALDRYPARTVILMDVDCSVYGDLSPLSGLPGDVGISIRARPQMRRGRVRPRQVIVMASSRVVVFQPFNGAVAFAREWQRLCAGATRAGGDESAMVWAYLNCPWVAYYQIAPEFAAQGLPGEVPGAIIEHDSAHEKQLAVTWRGWVRGLEKRWLRTGRTRRATKHIPARRV